MVRAAQLDAMIRISRVSNVSSETPPQQRSRASIHEQRLKRQQGKPNKSQMRAAQSRQAQQGAAVSDAAPPAATAQTQRLTPAQRRAIERGGVARGTGLPVGVTPLTRAEEMAMIREDMNRLFIIAGVLLAGMLSLLFVIN